MKDPTVLIIEDNEGDIELIKEAFINPAIKKHIKICTNGEEAINFLKITETASDENKPNLILMDINLPKIDGKEVLNFIKGNAKLKMIPVVMLTSSRLAKDIYYAYENHANSYIVKPSNLKDFTEVIRCIEMFWINCVTYPKSI